MTERPGLGFGCATLAFLLCNQLALYGGGCASEPTVQPGEPPVTRPERLQKVESSKDIRQSVHEWLARVPLMHGYRALPRAHPTWEEWQAEGEALPAGAEDVLIERLAASTNNPSNSVTMGLGMIGGTRSVDSLANILTVDAPAWARHNAVWALGMIAESERVDVGTREEVIEVLGAAMTDPDANVRAQIYGSLGSVGGERARSFVKQGLADTDSFARQCADLELKQVDSLPRKASKAWKAWIAGTGNYYWSTGTGNYYETAGLP